MGFNGETSFNQFPPFLQAVEHHLGEETGPARPCLCQPQFLCGLALTSKSSAFQSDLLILFFLGKLGGWCGSGFNRHFCPPSLGAQEPGWQKAAPAMITRAAARSFALLSGRLGFGRALCDLVHPTGCRRAGCQGAFSNGVIHSTMLLLPGWASSQAQARLKRV